MFFESGCVIQFGCKARFVALCLLAAYSKLFNTLRAEMTIFIQRIEDTARLNGCSFDVFCS